MAQSADRPVALSQASARLVARVPGLGRLSAVIRMSPAALRVPVGRPTCLCTSSPWPGSWPDAAANSLGVLRGAAIRIRASARDPLGFGERMAAGGARFGVGGDFVGAL